MKSDTLKAEPYAERKARRESEIAGLKEQGCKDASLSRPVSLGLVALGIALLSITTAIYIIFEKNWGRCILWLY